MPANAARVLHNYAVGSQSKAIANSVYPGATVALSSGKEHQIFVRRINRSIIAMNIALVLTSLLAFYAVWRIGELSRVTLEDHAQDQLLVQELRIEMERAVSLDRAFLLVGDPSLIDQYRKVEEAFQDHVERLKRRIRSPEGKRLLAAVITGKREHREMVERAMRLKAANSSSDEVAHFFEREVQPRTSALQTLLSDLLSHKAASLQRAGQTAEGATSIAWWVLLVLALANIAFGIVIRWSTRTTLTALDRYGTDLVQAVRARDEFLAIASHELRTPLAVIKLQTQMLRRRLEVGSVVAHGTGYLENFVAQVDRAVNSLSMLVSRMLDTANISGGKLLLHKEDVDLTQLTQDIVAQLKPVLTEAGSTVHFHAGEPVGGHWDRARLDQVVTNLLINIARHAPGQSANATVSSKAGKARLIIEDSGPGIATEDHARIFERFERAHLATDGGGMGLGLAVSKEIVEAHGGQLRVESEVGKGARFILELPMS